ncbi:trypsin-like peptidase domain-containing protein [Bacillus cereus group sp. RP32]|uniref:trypsin-like serine peptidase n=1 Tax=Bacillus cereus group sp. RP32 TaxID=3040258 RepID=UPI0033977D90
MTLEKDMFMLTTRESNVRKAKFIEGAFKGKVNRPIEYEVHIGPNDLLPVAYLEMAIEKSKTVAFIELPNGGASGFLVGKDLLLTNNHVFPDASTANQAVIRFNFENDIHGNPKPNDDYYCNAGQFFYTNESLDFSLVKVNKIKRDDNPSNNVALPGERWGYNTIFSNPNDGNKVTLTIEKNLNIVQHPGMRKKEIGIRNNTFDGLNKEYPDFLRYKTDTEPGSSGSPIYNDSWELVGLHHSAGESKNGVFVNNEGILISSIINDMLMNFPAMENGNQILAQLGIKELHNRKGEGGSVSASGTTDSRGNSSVTVTGTWTFK